MKEAARAAARAELLLQEEAGYLEAEGMEKTFKFRQDQIFNSLDVNTASKVPTLISCRCLWNWGLICLFRNRSSTLNYHNMVLMLLTILVTVVIY